MSKRINHFIFGSCGAHDGPLLLVPMGFAPHVFGQLGFGPTPYALSTGAALQLYDFCVGERELSEHVRLLAYMDVNQPTSESRTVVDETEIALIELSTPIEPMIDDAVVNFNRIEDFVLKPLRLAGANRGVLSAWTQALILCRDDLPERRRELLADWPGDFGDCELARFAVEHLRSRRLDVDDMVRDLELLRDRIRVPITLKFYDFQYMSDGRAIEWPRGFKVQQIEIARRMALPTLDLHSIVEVLGAGRVIEADLRHWRRGTLGLQAELIYDFMAFVLDRQPLETFPDWVEGRSGMLASFPDLLDTPARLRFRDLATFPRSSKAKRPPRPLRDLTVMGPPTPAVSTQPSTRRLAKWINEAIVSLHRRRLEELGTDGSGLFAHYKAWIEVESVIRDRERAAFELLRTELPTYDAYVVMRAGLGELAFLIGAIGRRVIACDPEPARKAAIEAGRDHLEAIGLLEPGSVTVLGGWRPEKRPKGRVLGVALDAVLSGDEAGAAALMPRLNIFEGLLIEPRLFLRMRTEGGERHALASDLHALGFDRGKDLTHGLAWYSRSRKQLRWWPRVDPWPRWSAGDRLIGASSLRGTNTSSR